MLSHYRPDFHSLMTNDEHLFMSLLAICASSSKKYLFNSFGHFLIELLVFLFWSYRSSLYFLDTKSYQIYDFQICSPTQ